MKDREVSLNQKQNMLCSPSVKCAYSSREVNKKTYFQTFGICWPRSNSQTCACNSFPSFPSSPCLTKGHPKFQQKLSRHHKFRDLHKCSIKADLFNIFPLIYVSFCNWFYIKNTTSCASPCATPPHSSFFFLWYMLPSIFFPPCISWHQLLQTGFSIVEAREIVLWHEATQPMNCVFSKLTRA